LEAQLAKGDLNAATTWLRDNVQRHGGLYEPREVITRACGFEPFAGLLLRYLDTKFSALC
ncbi:MAG: carboxypeptidase M32, partial [Pseudomonadota bacterium]